MKNIQLQSNRCLVSRVFFFLPAADKLILFSITVVLLLLSSNVSAVTITITSNTNWSSIITGSGTGGQPNSSDDIIIRNQATLSVDVSNGACKSITLGGSGNNNIGNLSFNTSTQVTVSGTITFATHGNKTNTLYMNNDSYLICQGFAVGVSGSNTFTHGNGTVVLTTTNTLPNSVLTNFNNLQINSDTTTLGTNIIVDGTLTLAGTGSLSLGSSTLTYGSSSALNYAGSSAQTTTTAEFPANGVKNLTINNTYGVIINASKTISGNATISPLCNLTINASHTLTVGGNFLIQSDETGTGSFIDNGTLVVSGTKTVQKYLTNGRYWYLGAPMSDATAIAFSTLSSTPGSGNRLFYWDETTHAYINVTNTSDAMPQLRGYSFKANGGSPITATYTGILSTGTIGGTSNLTYTSGSSAGYNLISNPYPSAIDLGPGDYHPGITMTNLDNSVWYRVDTYFATYNYYSGIGQNGGTRYIPAMQGFWVQVISPSGGGFQVNNTARCHDPNKNFYKVNFGENIFRIQAEKDSLTDEAVIAFFPSALGSYDPYDSQKMFSTNAGTPQVYTITSDSIQVAINGLEDIAYGSETILPLGFLANDSGMYTLHATNISDFDPAINIYLEDRMLNYFQDLRQSDIYTFSSSAVNDTNRFKLHFGSIITGISEENSFANIYSYSKEVYISNLKENCYIDIYNVLGKIIIRKQAIVGLNKIQVGASNGVYIVKVQSGSNVMTKKVIIN